jgi:hypothetical protein
MADTHTESGGASPGTHTPSHGAEEVKAAAEETAERLRHEAEELARDAKQRAESLAEEQKGVLAEELESVVGALRATARNLDEQHQRSAARYTEWAAERLGDVSRSLREKDLGGVLNDAENFARRQPGVFFGGAVAAGFLLSRFLKSSAGRQRTGPYDR